MDLIIENIEQAIVETKKKIKHNLPDLKGVFHDLERSLEEEVNQIESLKRDGQSIIPEIRYEAIDNRQIDDDMVRLVKQRGCVIVREVFPRARVEVWNDELAEYIATNGYFEQCKEKAHLDKYFAALDAGKPQVFGIYWSRPQVLARQDEAMAKTKTWLNQLWQSQHNGEQIFNPMQECTYVDRVRQREPGDSSFGLSPHLDAGSVERWLDEGYRKVYRHIFSGNWQDYDPFYAAYRTETSEIPSPAVAHVFRTFQGWTALTPQGPNDGTLRLIPISRAVAYVLLRALLDDVPDDSLCDALPSRALTVSAQWHGMLLRALVSIPVLYPGDTVWWHPDVTHSVEERHNGIDYSSVMYIGASPFCEKNSVYLKGQGERFIAGESPPDFAPENYETQYRGRATLEDLTDLGKKQMGFLPW